MTVRQHFALGLNNQREKVWRATVIAAFDERDRASASPLIVVPRDAPGIPMQLQRAATADQPDRNVAQIRVAHRSTREDRSDSFWPIFLHGATRLRGAERRVRQFGHS